MRSRRTGDVPALSDPPLTPVCLILDTFSIPSLFFTRNPNRIRSASFRLPSMQVMWRASPPALVSKRHGSGSQGPTAPCVTSIVAAVSRRANNAPGSTNEAVRPAHHSQIQGVFNAEATNMKQESKTFGNNNFAACRLARAVYLETE